VIVVVMPGEPTAIHLDMLFTQIDRDLCVVSPRHFIGPERLAVLHRRKGQEGIREMPDFFAALREVDFALEPILCGGEQRGLQEREQWASGCNLLSLRPGVACAYQRNEETLDQLDRAGFGIVEAEDYLSEDSDAEAPGRRVITFRGSELVRGGGGPRCMTFPFRRDQL
jgi:arginine deiminase